MNAIRTMDPGTELRYTILLAVKILHEVGHYFAFQNMVRQGGWDPVQSGSMYILCMFLHVF